MTDPVTQADDAFLPSGFRERMRAMLGDEYEAFVRSFNKPLHPSLRVNPLKIPDDMPGAVGAVLPFPLTPVPWVKGGFMYPDSPDVRPGRHAYHEAGLYYIQEASAMIPASLCPPVPGDRVLDLCAAPGGKATQAAGALHGEGLLVANEINAGRAAVLSQNIERMGVRNAIVTNETPAALAAKFPLFFDKIIVDAPCSGEGMFRKEEQALTMWSQENVELCAARQREILTEADKMLAPGGYLTYSTCTFAPEENEETVAWFLSTHPDYTTEDPRNPLIAGCLASGLLDRGNPDWLRNMEPDESVSVQLRRCIRLFPHHADGEGHFAVLLHKKGEPAPLVPEAPKKKQKTKPVRQSASSGMSVDKAAGLLADFCREVLGHTLPGTPKLFGEMLYLLPDVPGLDASLTDGLRVLRAGLQTGSVHGGRFEPSHSLALALCADDCAHVLPLDEASDQTADWLRGETIPCDPSLRGWHLITVMGFPIGWGKASSGMMKNHYPKGLRKP